MKNNIFIHNALIRYLVESGKELKKVSWPTRSEIASNTIIVLASVVIAMGVTVSLDYGLSSLVQLVANRGL